MGLLPYISYNIYNDDHFDIDPFWKFVAMPSCQMPFFLLKTQQMNYNCYAWLDCSMVVLITNIMKSSTVAAVNGRAIVHMRILSQYTDNKS